MSIETKTSPENQSSPFNVEKIEPINMPVIETTDDYRLSINGVVQEKYKNVSKLRPGFQKNNPNLLYFDAFTGDKQEKIQPVHVIDISNPGEEVLTITKDREENVLVNGSKWDSLRGRESLYYGGYYVEVDPDGGKVVFHEIEGKNRTVIVNNAEWKTKFDEIHLATSRFGTAYAAGKQGGEQMLVVEDKKWEYPQFNPVDPKDSRHRYEYDSDSIRDAIISKNNQVAAVVSSMRSNKWRDHVLIGDKVGAQSEWKHTLAHVQDLIVDDKTNSVAVFGETEPRSGKMALVINDVLYPIEGNPKELECFKFQDGGVLIQYTDILGKKVSEKIVLREDAKEVQEMNASREAAEEAFRTLRQLLIKERIPLTEIVARLKMSDSLKEEVERGKKFQATIINLEGKVRTLESTLSQGKKTHEEEKANMDARISNLERVLEDIKQTLEGLGKGIMSSNFKLPPDVRNRILKIIDGQIEPLESK